MTDDYRRYVNPDTVINRLSTISEFMVNMYFSFTSRSGIDMEQLPRFRYFVAYVQCEYVV